MKALEDHVARERMVEEMLRAGLVQTTREQYLAWVVRYRASRRAGESRNLQGFLDVLSSHPEKRVNPKTVRQALCALKFYHEKVLGIEIPANSLRVPKVNRNRNVPDCMEHEEVMALLDEMTGLPRLQAEFLYGTGSRITAMLKLRLKDLDLARGTVTFRHDKGGKSRVVLLPRVLMKKLAVHIESVKEMWRMDAKAGVICPMDDRSLMRKLGEKRFGSLPFYYLFPSARLRGKERWYSTAHALEDAVREAAERAGITRRVTPHAFRHSNATALLEAGETIRVVQEHMGHTDVKTTEIYTHAIGAGAVLSPLDAPPRRRMREAGIVPFPGRYQEASRRA